MANCLRDGATLRQLPGGDNALAVNRCCTSGVLVTN
jgi:hypothetical protein